MMKRRLPAYDSAGAGVGVVRGELDAGRLGQARLRGADREDETLRAVIAVRGVEDEALPVCRRALPMRPVPDAQAGTLREGDQALLHLGP